MIAIGVVGLGFGDEAKGSVIDWLSRRHPGAVNVRFNGGPQAAHNVVTEDGRHHTFSQFGSGMFEPTTSTVLSRHMLVDPLNMVTEEEHLRSVGVTDAFTRTAIDERCLIVTPYHRAVNRLREMTRGDERHGSCGLGLGECVQDSLLSSSTPLRAGDLPYFDRVDGRLERLRARMISEVEAMRLPSGEVAERELAVLYSDVQNRRHTYARAYVDFADKVKIGVNPFPHDRPLLFEGAQGVLLDEEHGFHPHTTWSNCTFGNAEDILMELGYMGKLDRWGVTRSYQTRHGVGPFPTEDPDMLPLLPERHNNPDNYQGAWRVGALDLVALRYAMRVCDGVDRMVMTHIDAIPHTGWDVCTAYTFEGEMTTTLLLENIWKYEPVYRPFPALGYARLCAEALGLPIAVTSHGPTFADKLARM